MASTTIQKMSRDMAAMKKSIAKIEIYLREEFELSEYAKKELRAARATDESEYMDL